MFNASNDISSNVPKEMVRDHTKHPKETKLEKWDQ